MAEVVGSLDRAVARDDGPKVPAAAIPMAGRPKAGLLQRIDWSKAGLLVGLAIFVIAAREGLLSLVAVISSLYPASTVVLARVVLHERVDRRQQVGLACALVGVVLIAA